MARERRGTLVWRAKGWCALVALFGGSALVSCGTTIGECDIMCPNGVDITDPRGCTCLPDDGGPQDVSCGDVGNFPTMISTNWLLHCQSHVSADASADAGGE